MVILCSPAYAIQTRDRFLLVNFHRFVLVNFIVSDLRNLFKDQNKRITV